MIALNNGDVLAIDLTGTATIGVHIPYATTTGITLVPASYTASLSADATLITASGVLLLRNIYLLASANCNARLTINGIAIISADLKANKQWAFINESQPNIGNEANSSTDGHIILDEADVLPQRSKLAITGAGISASDDAANDATIINVPGATSGGHIILEEGTALPQRSKLNFIGGGLSVSDDAANDATIINVPPFSYGCIALGTAGTPSSISAPGSAIISVTSGFDDDSYWDSANPTRLTAQKAGWYLLSGFAGFSVTAAMRVGLRFRLNGNSAAIFGYTLIGASSTTQAPYISIQEIVYLSSGDYAELQMVASGSTGSLSVASLSEATPRFSISRLGF